MRRYSPRPRSTFVAAALLASLAIGSCAVHEKGHTPQSAWIAGWMAAPSWRPQNPRQNEMTAYSNQSVRQDVRIGFAADHVRLRLSNELGDEAIEVGRIRIAKIGPGDTLGSPVVARFDGQESATLRPGEALISDSIALKLPAFADLAISVYYPGAARPVAHRLMVRVAGGPEMPGSALPQVRGPAIVSAIEIAAAPAAAPAVIMAFGDSITEGAGSHTPHVDWPSLLAERLQQSCPGGFVVLNAGIGGNRLLGDGGSPGALSRLDRDVLSVTGVSHVILLEGINDIRQADDSGSEGTAEDLVTGYRQIIGRLHSRGIKVIGATLTPYEGTARQTARGAASVAHLNELIRGGGLFDGVIDFYPALEDPASPGRMRPELSSGDWLHPGERGYAAMAEAIPTSLFGPCKRIPR
jgi:lysophospholipase L1-like esterase